MTTLKNINANNINEININSTEIRKLINDEISDLKILQSDFTNASYEVLFTNKTSYSHYLDANTLDDFRFLSRFTLMNILEKVKLDLKSNSTTLGNSRIKFLSSVNEYKWFKNIFQQIKNIIQLPSVVQPLPAAVVQPLPAAVVQPLPAAVVQPLPIVVQLDNFVIAELNQQMQYMISIDNIIINKPDSYDQSDSLESDITNIFGLFNILKGKFNTLLMEYSKAVIEYIKLLVIKKIIERFIQLRAESCPEEVIHQI